MREDVEATIGRWLGRWVDAVARHARWVATVILAATVAIFAYTVSNLGIQGDTESLFSKGLPFKQAERRYQDAFPLLYENIFVVVDALTPEQADAAVSALAARLGREPETVRSAYLPGGGEFFESHAFLYLETEELEDLADRLAEVQPYMAELARDGSLRGLASITARGARAAREGEVSGGRLAPIFDGIAEALDARVEGHPYQLSWAEVLAGSGFDVDARRRFLLVQPVLDHADIQPARAAIIAVRRIAEELRLTPERGVRVRITGDAALSYEEMETVSGQAATAGIASFVLVGFILGIGLRSVRLVFATLITLTVGLVWTAGFTAAAIGHLNLISVTFAVLFIGLGVDFGIHLCVRYGELLSLGRSHQDALVESARDVGTSIALCASTTAIGFLAFVPTDFVGVAELGLISGAGMFISLFCTLTLLPALLSLVPFRGPASGVRGLAWSGSGLGALPLRHPRAVRVVALALGVGAVLLLPKARFDNNPLRVRDPSAESVRTFQDLLEQSSTSPWSLNAVAPDLEHAEELAEKLRGLGVVARVVTVSDYVPPDQEQKLDIIGDVALFLAPPPGPDGAVPAATPDEQRTALRDLHVEVMRLVDEGGPVDLAPSAQALERSLSRFRSRLLPPSPSPTGPDGDRELAILERDLLGTLPRQLDMLDTAIRAGRVTLENLPGPLLERMVSADGRVRIQIFPSADLLDHAALAAFVDGVRRVAPDVAGSAAEVLESGRAVVGALRQALLSAFVAVTLFLFLLWRRLDDTALVMIPLSLAAALTMAASVLLDIPFNFADVIVLPLLLGIGVDSGVHLVHRARLGRGDENLLATSTARAVAVSALTTIASFGTLGFASHMGMATLGRLLTLGVSFTVLCNLIVLPALITLRAPRRRLVERPSQAA